MIPPPIAPEQSELFVAPSLPPLSTATQALFAGVAPAPPQEPFGRRLGAWAGGWMRKLEGWMAHTVAWLRSCGSA